MTNFGPFRGIKKGRIDKLVTPDLSHFIEGAVVRA